MTYEAGMQELEELVSRLESGDMPLEESFKAFEKGVKAFGEIKKKCWMIRMRGCWN